MQDRLAFFNGVIPEHSFFQLLQLHLQLFFLPKFFLNLFRINHRSYHTIRSHYIYLQDGSHPSWKENNKLLLFSSLPQKSSLSLQSLVLQIYIIPMSSANQEEDSIGQVNFLEKQGTMIIAVAPKEEAEVKNSKQKKSKRRSDSRREKFPKIMNQYKEHLQHEKNEDDSKEKQIQRHSEGKIRAVDEQTAGDMQEGGLPIPYEFLIQRSPSLFRIFFPRFALCSITFWLSVLYVLMFLVLIGYNYSKEQTEITWNCSLYLLQNKYFPRLNQDHEVWRVLASAFFHSNIAHFCLNLFAMQIYGYFIEWYYGKRAYVSMLVLTIIFSHFFASIVQTTSVSTTSSAVTMAIVALKIYFLWQYRNYRKLYDRRSFLYILMGLVIGINLIPIFVVNNVDFSAHLGGFIVGFMLGLFFYKKKIEEPTKCDLVFKWGSVILLAVMTIVVVAMTFSMSGSDYEFLAVNIQTMCENNHT